MEAIIRYLAEEGRVILKAPFVFLIALATIGTAIWGVISVLYAARIDTYEGRLKLRDDQITDYKNKLSGATPDEAQKRIQALELQVKI